MSTEESVYSPAQLVTMAWDRGMARSTEIAKQTDQYFDDAIQRALAFASMDAASLNFDATVAEPMVNIPTSAEGASLTVFEDVWENIVDKLSVMYAGYMEKFFPNECNYLQHAQQWICNAITQGGTGINAHIEEQIWQRDRARILRDAARAESELVGGYAARGWPLPTGAMQAGIANLQMDTLDKVAQASRDVAIKQAEMEVENVRFAIERAIGLYGVAIGAAKDYVVALSSSVGTPAQLLPSITDSQSRLISAASSYYQSRIAAKELKLKAAMPNAEWQQQANVRNLDAQMQSIQNMVNAAVEAAKALSTQAAAMLNALHVSSGTSASGSHSVSYGYSGEVTGDVPPHTV